MQLRKCTEALAIAALAAFIWAGQGTAAGLVDRVGGVVGKVTKDVSKSVGSTVGKTTSGLSSATSSLGKAAGGLASSSSSGGTNTTTLGSKTGTSAKVTSGNGTIEAAVQDRLNSMSRKQLAAVCNSVGGNGCSTATRQQLLGIIDVRMETMGPRRLASLCVSINGGCGGTRIRPRPPGTVDPDGKPGPIKAWRSGSKVDQDVILTCRKILASPKKYDPGMVKLCRAVKL
ncbi:MAG: hypothetical protein LCH46_10230 [Proteobacteria bacterium]|nr:hypothetical protein [Pseudomonadota bacterium]